MRHRAAPHIDHDMALMRGVPLDLLHMFDRTIEGADLSEILSEF
jgi:hypothetical protein